MSKIWYMSLVLALAGCGTGALLDGLPPNYIAEDNYLTFEHAFTDATLEAVRRRAESHCANKRLAAVRTSGTCSLTRCTTHYQCMSPADAKAFQPQDGKK